MFLYSVLRWGNQSSDDGPDGDDTEFLVKAVSVEEASDIVDDAIKEKNLMGFRVQNFCHSIVEIGVSHSTERTAKIVFGPVISSMSVFSDDGIPNDKKWVRDNLDEGWVKYADYYGD